MTQEKANKLADFFEKLAVMLRSGHCENIPDEAIQPIVNAMRIELDVEFTTDKASEYLKISKGAFYKRVFDKLNKNAIIKQARIKFSDIMKLKTKSPI